MQSLAAASRGQQGTLTSVGVGELGAAQEAQVARPGPHRLRIAEAQPGVEVVRLQHLLAVAAVVAAAVVGAVHPDLQRRSSIIFINSTEKRWMRQEEEEERKGEAPPTSPK